MNPTSISHLKRPSFWQGALLALGVLAAQARGGEPASVLPPPPIPVRFTLKAPGYVTLVLEDKTGQRVRNLVSETCFPEGDNVAWWDGMNDRNSTAVPAAALGRANDWDLLKTEAFKPLWPKGVDLKGDYWANQAMFVWSDLNGDGRVQPEEVTLVKGPARGITVLPDLSFAASYVDGRAVRYAPRRFTEQAVPIYDLEGAKLWWAAPRRRLHPEASQSGGQP